jgi:hypothetical protein
MADRPAILAYLLAASCCIFGMASDRAAAQDFAITPPPRPTPPPGPYRPDPRGECRLPAPVVTTPEALGAFIERSNDFARFHEASDSRPPPVRDVAEVVLHRADLELPDSLRNSDRVNYATVLVSLSEAGGVRETLLVCTTDPEFGNAAVDAVSRSKYRARSINGIPVPGWFPQRFATATP